MAQNLNYHHLYYFKVIAEENGIANASKKLRLGQPTLSTQLKQFEDSLGYRLFERRNRRMILSEQGQVVLNYAKEIFNLGDEMLESLKDEVHSSRLHLNIGAQDGIPKTLIARLIQEILKLGAGEISVLENSYDEMIADLKAHKIDLLVTNREPMSTDQNKFFMKKIHEHSITVFGSSKFEHLKNLHPQSLNGQKFILPTRDSKLRQDMENYFYQNQIQPLMVAETQDTSLMKILAQQGVGLIGIPEFAVQDLVLTKQLFKSVTLNGVTEKIYLIKANRKVSNPMSDKIFDKFKLF